MAKVANNYNDLVKGSLNYYFFVYTHIYIRTNPITLPCSLARTGNISHWKFRASRSESKFLLSVKSR